MYEFHAKEWKSRRDLVPFWPLDPGSEMGKKSRSGPEVNIPDNISENNFLG